MHPGEEHFGTVWLDYVHPVTDRTRQATTVAFYSVLGVLLLAILLKVLPAVLPDLIAGRIARNSEGILLALLLAPWIQFVRPRLAGAPAQWQITLGVSAVSLGIGIVLFLTDPINQVKTLNESFLAAAVLIPYIQLRRPLPLALPVGLSLGLLALILVAHSTSVITLTAEGLGALVLVPIGLDVVDRGVLDPSARTVTWQRLAWYAFLLLGPLIFWRTNNGATLQGGLNELITYAGRTTEIFLCLLALHFYFAVGLGRGGAGHERPDTANSPAAETPPGRSLRR
jgi:hypothetical protein